MPAHHATFRIWRGDRSSGQFQDYTTPVTEGMVVLDAVHQIQGQQANDLAVRWNCKAGKCGSCSAEINGNPRLMCMTRLNQLNTDDVPLMAQVSERFGVDTSKQGSERFGYASREDVLEGLRKSLPHEKALANAPDADENFFKVPKVIER